MNIEELKDWQKMADNCVHRFKTYLEDGGDCFWCSQLDRYCAFSGCPQWGFIFVGVIEDP